MERDPLSFNDLNETEKKIAVYVCKGIHEAATAIGMSLKQQRGAPENPEQMLSILNEQHASLLKILTPDFLKVCVLLYDGQIKTQAKKFRATHGMKSV